MMSAHLPKNLREQFGRRSLPVRKGDDVRIMRGKFAGTAGKIADVNLKKMYVTVENVKRKKVSGSEIPVKFHPSNIMITNPVMDDAKRKKIIDRRMKK